jgi:hypothetical protein
MNGQNDMNEHDEMIARLEAERPVPAAGFRGDLRRRLVRSGERRGVAPARVRRLIFAYAGAGTALLLVVVLGVAGAGPFAA